MATIIRKVAVMMPFGGHDRTMQRSCMLNFLRLKYIVEKKVKNTVDLRGEIQEIGYEVTGFYATVGGIADPAVRTIRNADILIGLITEKNVNVIYELAVRSLLVDVPILVVKGDPDEMLPLYLKGLSSIDYDKHTPQKVLDQIDQLAMSEFPDPLSLQTPIPDLLKDATEKYDKSLTEELGRALLQMEGPPMEGPRGPLFKDLLDEVARNYNPAGILKKWEIYYPMSIVKMNWKRRSRGANGYTKNDMDGEPVVCVQNDDFLKLYNFGSVMEINSLTLQALINQLNESQIVNEKDLKELVDDQAKLTKAIIMLGGFSQAQVPLRINGNHPRLEYRNKAYLPCLIGKRIDGDTSKPHCMYLLVCYVEVQQFDPKIQGSSGKEETPEPIQNGE